MPVNVRPVVYCTAITEGNASTWEFMWTRFETENVAAEQVVILSALGCTKDQAVLKVFRREMKKNVDESLIDSLQGYLDKIISHSVRLQDKQAAFTSTYNNHDANVQIVLDYVIANYTAIRES